MLQMEVVARGGTPAVVKRGVGDAARSLRLTGERLRRAAHPGVVEVVSSTGDDRAWELHLAHAGRPLESLGRTSAIEVARLAASVAETLADLHDIGIVHGRLDASHVLVAVDGRPVLCGFGPDDGGATASDDVAAVGALIVELLGRDLEMEPLPERRWRRRREWSGWQRRSLLLLADQAAAEPDTRRPSARRLAASIAEAVPDPAARSGDARRAQKAGAVALGPGRGPRRPATPSDDATPPPPTQERPPRSRPGSVLAALAAVSLLAVGLLQVVRPGAGATPAAPVPSPAVVPSTSGHGTSVEGRDHPPHVQVAGNVVSVGDRRYQVGEPGDIVVVGDWDCDGTDTPALLRPATGGLFVFERWADGSPTEVTPVRVVSGASGLRRLEEPGGCDRLAVRRHDGSEVAVSAERAT